MPRTHSTTSSAELEHVAVDLETHRLCGEPKRVQQGCVLFGRQHRKRPDIPVHCAGEWLLARDVGSKRVRHVIEVRRYLHGELATLREHCLQPSEQRVVVRHPLQRGVGEDDVHRLGRFPLRDVGLHE